ncbi:CMRF35-like molecule 3 [Gadus chalcogrammus]|uniref:CMRF35-like molecule 3 n=1 Tax=Gadus chalcogrammus TaxID=1042646 RepID=UPI0024C29223|nr:CMRF35-like molecule 3 [Gadus chalcogrammus]
MDFKWQFLLKLFLSLISGYCCKTSADWDSITPKEEVSDAERSVKLECPYPESHSKNHKFLCKGQSPCNCQVVVNSTQTGNQERRFSIWVNERLKRFTVTIMDTKGEDSGTYWCLSDRGRPPANYTKIHLTVKVNVKPSFKAASPRTPPGLTSEFPTRHQSPPTVAPPPTKNGSSLSAILSGILSVLLLGCLLLSFMMYRHRQREAQGQTIPYIGNRKIGRPPASDLGDDLVFDCSTRTLPTLETDSAHYASVRHPVSAPAAPRPPSSFCIYSAVNVIQSDR